MVSTARTAWPRTVLQAILAGICGLAAFDAYLWLTTELPAHQSISVFWGFVASAALGKALAAEPRMVWAGLAIDALVCIVWAGAYAYLAARQMAFNERWFASGVVFGIVVYVVMEIVLGAGGSFTYPASPNAFVNLVIAHTLFFGVPVAYVVRALQAPTLA